MILFQQVNLHFKIKIGIWILKILGKNSKKIVQS